MHSKSASKHLRSVLIDKHLGSVIMSKIKRKRIFEVKLTYIVTFTIKLIFLIDNIISVCHGRGCSDNKIL